MPNAQTPPQLTDEEKREVLHTAAQMHPGRDWSQLSPEEQSAVYSNFEADRDFGVGLLGTPAPQGKTVGPSGLYVAPNWGESFAHAMNQVAGGYMVGQANKREKSARKANASMIERRDALDRSAEQERNTREDERRREWLTAILSRG